MRRLFALMFLALVCGLFPSHAHAQMTQNACVQQFYNTAEFNQLSFKNVCGSSVYVVWMSLQPGLRGSVNVRPGTSSSIGRTAKDVQLFGGITIYACFSGYTPVDAAGRMVYRPIGQFWCKRG
jgi:hypothetical protein